MTMLSDQQTDKTKDQERKPEKGEKIPISPIMQNLIDAGVPIDHGWAWVVCFATFLSQMFILGQVRASGILFVEISAAFELNKATTMISFMSSAICSIISTPIASFLIKRLTIRIVAMIGGLFVFIGFSLSSFVYSYPLFIVTYSIIAGFGYGFLFTPTIAVVSQYFCRRRSLATGIAMCGPCCGAFTIPPLITYLTEQYSFRGMLLIVGAIYSNILVSASLMRPFIFYIRQNGPKSTEILDPKPTPSKAPTYSPPRLTPGQRYRKLISKPIFRNPRLYICTIATAVMTECFVYSLVVIPPLAADINLPRPQITTILFVMGVPDLVGRIFIGWIADKNLIPRWHLICILACVQAIIWSAVTFFVTFEGLLIFGIIVGLSGGGIITLFAPVIADAIGVGNINIGLALAMIFKLPILSVPILLGAIRDLTGKWIWSYRCLTVILVLSVLIFLLNICIKEETVCRRPDNPPEPEHIKLKPNDDIVVVE